MKKLVVFSIIAFLLSACAPSTSYIQTSVAQTIIATMHARETEDSLIKTIMPDSISKNTITLTQTPIIKRASVNIVKTSLFLGPSVYHKMVMCEENACSFPLGSQVNIVKKHEHYGEIWYFVLTSTGESGWVYGGWLKIEGSIGNIPRASFIPTYPPSPTSATPEPNPTNPKPSNPNPSNPKPPPPQPYP
jgi:hypothetical protein